jgi:hypothetical protein
MHGKKRSTSGPKNGQLLLPEGLSFELLESEVARLLFSIENPVCQTVLSPSAASLSLHAYPHISSTDSFMTHRIRIRPGQDREGVLKSLCFFSLFIPPPSIPALSCQEGRFDSTTRYMPA